MEMLGVQFHFTEGMHFKYAIDDLIEQSIYEPVDEHIDHLLRRDVIDVVWAQVNSFGYIVGGADGKRLEHGR